MAHTVWNEVDVMFTSATEKTFQHDNQLPSLPVPTLQHTLERYLDSVRPHVTDAEYRQTEFIVQQFSSGMGKDLHKQLVQKAANNKNWLEKWWLDYAYMDFRLPIAPLLNFAGPGPYMFHILPKKEGSQIERAALIMYLNVRFWHLIRNERLRPDKDSKGQYFCMNQFRRLYSTCRIPAPQRDHLNTYFKTTSEGNTPLTLCVFCRGRIFIVKVVDDNEEPITALELQKQFQYIRDLCDSQPEGVGIGALTGDNRTSWAQIRSRLIAISPQNYQHLEMIQQSIIAVSLEDSSPADENELLQAALAGDSTNRWFDKSISMLFFKNGLAASNCDHSPMDAMVLVVSTYYVDLQVQACQGKWQGSQEIRTLDTPQELVFVLDDVIYRGIASARQVYSAHANNLMCCALQFTEYGKKFMRDCKLHPDTNVQLSLQYAYYKMYRKPAPTYQTGTTRKFYNARTETVRSCTNEALEWSKAMLDPNLPSNTKMMLYKTAADKHNKLMAEATENQGCDRHLFGLQLLALESGQSMPQLYTDPSYVKSGGGGIYILSTSFVGYTPVYGGVVPMVEHGYGTFYRIEQNSISTFVSAWKSSGQTDALKFSTCIHECLHEIGSLIAATQPTARM